MKKLFIFLVILCFIYADIDPFKAGNLNSPQPYGLTPQEKIILDNKKNIQKNKNSIKELKLLIEKLKSDITQKLLQYDQTIADLENKFSSFSTLLNEIDTTKNNIKNLQKKINEYNITQIKEDIKKLDERVKKLENYQLTIKNSIQEITKIQNQNFEYLSKSIQTILNQLKQKNLSPKEAFKKAKRMFFNGNFNEAKDYFLYSLNKNYLPATSSYYLGEIAYKQGNYKGALAYYKKSISLYSKKTSFTDKLLYHTAISFKKLNKIKSAKITLKKLINDFPNSKYSKLAKKVLEKL